MSQQKRWAQWLPALEHPPASKKPPPLSGDVIWGAATEDLWLVGLVKLANGSDLAGWTGLDGREVVEDTPRPANASSKSLRFDFCCTGGDCIPPKDPWLLCCTVGCGFGAEAYKERIDCFKSGLDGTFEFAGLDDELDGRFTEAAGGPPKKSSPNSESDALTGFGGAACFGGGRAPGVSVVLGRAGGFGTSPKRSTCGVGLGGGWTGWFDVDAAR